MFARLLCFGVHFVLLCILFSVPCCYEQTFSSRCTFSMASWPEYDFGLDNSLPSYEQSDSESITSESSILPAEFIEENYFRCDDDLINTVDNTIPSVVDDTISSVSSSPPRFVSTPVPSSAPIMEKLGQCRKFTGYSHDNAEKFLREFESYTTLHNIDAQSPRKVAAFHLHLQGPALQWYNGLDPAVQSSWANLVATFKAQYVSLDWQSPTIMYESEAFQSMSLAPSQSIEDYFSLLSEKGQLLKKPEHELVVKFVNGLPDKLAFFVRAGQPKDLRTALASAKMGEGFGYRTHASVPSVSHVSHNMPPSVSHVSGGNPGAIAQLQEQVETLTNMVQSMQVKAPPEVAYNSPKAKGCFACHGLGHRKKECNWTGTGEINPSTTCQICFQNGHSALSCRRFVTLPPPSMNAYGSTHNTQNVGNAMPPGNMGRHSRGGRHF